MSEKRREVEEVLCGFCDHFQGGGALENCSHYKKHKNCEALDKVLEMIGGLLQQDFRLFRDAVRQNIKDRFGVEEG